MDHAVSELNEQMQSDSLSAGDQLRSLVGDLSNILRAKVSGKAYTTGKDGADGADGDPGAAELEVLLSKMDRAVAELSGQISAASDISGDQLRSRMSDFSGAIRAKGKMLVMEGATTGNSCVDAAAGVPGAAELKALLVTMEGAPTELREQIQAASKNTADQLLALIGSLDSGPRATDNDEPVTAENDDADAAGGGTGVTELNDMILKINHAISGLSEKHQSASERASSHLRALAADLGSLFPSKEGTVEAEQDAKGAGGGLDAAQLKTLLENMHRIMAELSKENQAASKGIEEQLRALAADLGRTPIETPSTAENTSADAADGVPDAAGLNELLLKIDRSVSDLCGQHKGTEEQLQKIMGELCSALRDSKPHDDPDVGSCTPGHPSGPEDSPDPSSHASALMIEEIHCAVLALKKAMSERRDDAREKDPSASEFELKAVLDSILKAVKSSNGPTGSENSASVNSPLKSAGDANIKEINLSLKSLRGEFKHIIDTQSSLLELQNTLGSTVMAKVLEALEGSPLLAVMSSTAAEQQKALLKIQAVQMKALSGANGELVNLPEQLGSLQQQCRDVSQQVEVMSREQADGEPR